MLPFRTVSLSLVAPPGTDLAGTAGTRWADVVAAYLAEVGQRAGSTRTLRSTVPSSIASWPT